ncbi:hypothetical protein HMPREF9733_00865 [Treponema denticola SP33]|uniref:Uncharacterized protein n=1 Tax=Treponema denticola SP33 TaxID=999437 RepID=M2BW54_TREDN|nr:hypothetical protein HMPREF9733_00865 [Treponema denticola SP33]EPF37007.1 hypothetical protein HMPREF9732_01036 [Treponema denticola SP32]
MSSKCNLLKIGGGVPVGSVEKEIEGNLRLTRVSLSPYKSQWFKGAQLPL